MKKVFLLALVLLLYVPELASAGPLRDRMAARRAAAGNCAAQTTTSCASATATTVTATAPSSVVVTSVPNSVTIDGVKYTLIPVLAK